MTHIGHLGANKQRGWIPAIVGAAGAIGGALISKSGGKEANTATAYQAMLNREFQERMSNTAHQREIKDLRKAGLNPILSATGGRGASTPSGSMAIQRDVLTPAVNTAMTARRLTQEIKNMKATEKRDDKDAQLKHWQSWLSQAATNTELAKQRQIDASILNTEALTKGIESQNVGRGIEADIYQSSMGWLIKAAEKIGLNVNSAKSLTRRRK